MHDKKELLSELRRFYSIWGQFNAVYEEWAKERGLSSNGVLILSSLYESEEACTQKSLSQKWSIPKQTVNSVLKKFIEDGYVELITSKEDKRNKLLKLTKSGRIYAEGIVTELQEKELFVIEHAGLSNIKQMNDIGDSFLKFFREGVSLEND